MRADRAYSRGFTLLEVLVAFIIASLALGVLFQGTLVGIRSARFAAHYEQATALARSHLAVLSVDNGLNAREVSGDDGSGFHWRGKITPLAQVTMRHSDTDTAEGLPPTLATLFGISVLVWWKSDGAEREVKLETARIAAVQDNS
jgi:general secretion pathway protein I